ncbi:MAG TPA: tripartite tricarboxylate transporter substrate-binding protein [Casimicrobiaceae bacterium]|nr:tripartite tricarboxylate transporter substrate-binding protein [Casimicrobiaceae bacterium]
MRILSRLLLLAFALAASVAFAQTYPTKPIRLVVPFGPGGSADAIARPLADKLGTVLGQSVVVDNRPGGLTVIGADLVAKAPPDGYTLYLMPGTHVLTPLMVQKVPYNPIADFTPVALLGSQPYMFVSNSQQPFKSFGDLVAYAKANPEKLSMGVSDAVTLTAASALRNVAKIDITIVNYKGGGPQNNDLLGNQIATAVVTPNTMPFVTEGRLRALAVTSPARVPFLPDVPTIAELIPGSHFDVQTWYGIAAPAKLPRAIVERLHAAIAKVIAEPDMNRRLADLGIVIPADTSPEATAAIMKNYQERMTKLVQAAGIKPE